MSDVEAIFKKINAMVGELFSWNIQVINDYPFVLIGTLLLVIYIGNHLTLSRFRSQEYSFSSLIFFLSGAYLFYKLLTDDSIVSFIGLYLAIIKDICISSYGETCNLIPNKFDNKDILIIVYIAMLIAIKSRLMWVLSVVALEYYFIIIKGETFYDLFSNIPEEHRYLFKGVVPFLLASPFLLIVWVFRDNDRFEDISSRQRELNLKSRELDLREREINIRSNEFRIKEKEYALAEKNLTKKSS